MIPYDDDDVHSLALMVWKEARNQSSVGMTAVGWVAVNRVGAPGFAGTLHDVIYGKNQFTSMSVPSDPQFNLEPVEGNITWEAAKEIAGAILADDPGCPDPTNGARWYANLKTSTSPWFFTNIVERSDLHPVTATLGAHTFFA